MSISSHITTFHRFILLLLLSFIVIAVKADYYPAHCRVTTTLNVRSGPSTGYSKIGKLYKGNLIIIDSVFTNRSRQWGKTDYKGRTGYVATQYVEYVNPVQEEPVDNSLQQSKKRKKTFFFWLTRYGINYIFAALVLYVAYILFRDAFKFIILAYAFSLAGGVITELLFNNYDDGACIGFAIYAFPRIRRYTELSQLKILSYLYLIFRIDYYLITIPIWFLNRLQLILMEPWRYLTKGCPNDGVRDFFRPILYPLEIILYILITPLRLVNAIIYNIFIYGITEILDLTVEVLIPSKESEGRESSIWWTILFPWRVIRYLLFNGSLVLIEGVIWTIMDIFIPTITMYHGTDLTAAQEIVGNDPDNWEYTTFYSSRFGWAGAGSYFGSARSTARGYAYDPYRLNDDNPVMIVCRVSLGKILNYGLDAPRFVHLNAGEYGDHNVITSFAKRNGYTTGEWWNPKGYWEYCMFDWQNAYNNPWRIRPVYVFNFRTGLAQPIEGGFRHWLFSRVVLRDIFSSLYLSSLLIFAILFILWLIFYGWNYIWNDFLQYYF